MGYIVNKAKVDSLAYVFAEIPYTKGVVPFLLKVPYWEGQTVPIPAEKGKDMGFSLIFGNYGEDPVPANPLVPTVEDIMSLPDGMKLKVMSICACPGYELWCFGSKVNVGDIFIGPLDYIFNVKTTGLGGTEFFPLEKHSVCCISILFQIEDTNTDEEPLILYKTDKDLASNTGAVRYRNFGEKAGQFDVLLSNSAVNLGTPSQAVENDVTWNQNGVNKIKFRYDATTGNVYSQVDSLTEIMYPSAASQVINAVQFKVKAMNPTGDVKLENIKLNGVLVVSPLLPLVGDISFPMWNLIGSIQQVNGDVVIEADLVLGGTQPLSQEANKVEIILGKLV